jgi:hypothetical protein
VESQSERAKRRRLCRIAEEAISDSSLFGMDALDAIATGDGDKSAEYLAALDGMVGAGDLAGCKAFVDHGAPLPARTRRSAAAAAHSPPQPPAPPQPCRTPCPSC